MEIESRRHTQTRGPLFALLDGYKPYQLVGRTESRCAPRHRSVTSPERRNARTGGFVTPESRLCRVSGPLWSSASLHCNVGLILVFQPKRSLPSSSSDLHFRQERESGMQVRTDLRVPPLVIRKSRSNRALAATPTLRLTSSDSGLGPAAAGLVRLLLLPKIWIASRTTFPMPASQILNRMSGAAVFAAAVAEPVLKEASFACMLHVQGVPLVRPLPPSIQSRHHRPIQKIGVTHRRLTCTT